MILAPGDRLGVYDIVARIGAGGMGEVYRARDTRLNRTVAIKIMSASRAGDPVFKERFEREARAISSLEHPNICPLYDVGEHDGISFLVMQHLEGETLEARLSKGPLPLDQALQCATEIADALDKAHREGFVHRDLKPGNVILTKSGAKLVDFGLAKSERPVGGDLSMLPTTPPNLTAQGSILGTFHYMAPEQIEGAEADRRTDIFSFGVVLYEMLTGKKAFEGRSQASLIASILEHEPQPVSVERPGVPRVLDHIARRCLAKDPEARWQSARDLCDELRWVMRDELQPPPPKASGRPMTASGWKRKVAIGIAVVIVTIATAAIASLYRQPALAEMRVDIAIPGATDIGAFALSPDGEQVAVAAIAGGKRQLWVRPLKSGSWRTLDGTEGAASPFWSPDSRSLGFFAGGKLKKTDVDGGNRQVLADASPISGAWNKEGVILFSPYAIGPLARIPQSGGVPVIATKTEALQTGHSSPSFLSDGRRFLFFTQGPPNTRGVFLGSLDSTAIKLVTFADSGGIVVPPGYLLFVTQGILRAQPFDDKTGELSGHAVPIANSVLNTISASRSGLIAYRSGSTRRTRLIWMERSGKVLGDFGPHKTICESPFLCQKSTTLVLCCE